MNRAVQRTSDIAMKKPLPVGSSRMVGGILVDELDQHFFFHIYLPSSRFACISKYKINNIIISIMLHKKAF